MSQNITILGSTGSIGVRTLEVIQQHPTDFNIFALTANSNIELLVKQAQDFKPDVIVIANALLQDDLHAALEKINFKGTVLIGEQGLVEVAQQQSVDSVMAAIVGAAGLAPTLAAAKAGKRIMLANKEALVMAGELFMQTVHDNNAELLPVDSEHNAIFQCFKSAGVRKIILTASGGPFRQTPLVDLCEVTPEQACAHPNWVMGRKISVDSATMMNKALEVIEAHYLFDMPARQIDVVIHPQSIVHSCVEYLDGSILAQMGPSDMRIPIAYALGYPSRMASGVDFLSLAGLSLQFEVLDNVRFPAVDLAYQAIEQGGTAATVINAANETAVAAFLEGKIKFTDITKMVKSVFESSILNTADSLTAILKADQWARDQIVNIINSND
jgi:1-deoxy-D-xylulose-5-phosphate reductoisomerase